MKDVFSNILPKYLGFRDYLNFGLSCKEYYSLLDIPKKRDETQKKIEELFSQEIIDMIGKNRLLYATEVPWNPKWLGSTSYIDSMRPKDFLDNGNMYYGKDSYGRPFIFLKTRVIKRYHYDDENYEKLNNYDDKNYEKLTMISLFQRYTDNKIFAAVDHTASGEILLEHRTRIDEELRLRIQSFLATGRIEKHTPESDTLMEMF